MLMNDFCDPSSRSMLVDTDWFPAHTDDTAVFSKTSVRCWTEDDDDQMNENWRVAIIISDIDCIDGRTTLSWHVLIIPWFTLFT
jgi:hypothetical protein